MKWIELSNVHQQRLSGVKAWHECSYEQYDQLLNALPPIYYSATHFMGSEAYAFSASEGATLYYAGKKEGDKYYLTLSTPNEYRNKYIDFEKTSNRSDEFIFHSDPSHGWLGVSIWHVKTLGIDVSDYSYQWSTYVYLEEDSDAPLFLKAYEDRYGCKPKIIERHTDKQSFIRNYNSYNN